MTAVAERLRELADAEQAAEPLALDTWPNYVERCYHVGRQSAFREAARLVEARTPTYLIWRAWLEVTVAALRALSSATVRWRSRTRARTPAPTQRASRPHSAAPPDRRDPAPMSSQGGRP
jgi:hypothetical protein